MKAKTLLATASLSIVLGIGCLSDVMAMPFASSADLASAPDATVQTVQYYRHGYYGRGSALRREGWYPGQGRRRVLAYRARHRFYRGY